MRFRTTITGLAMAAGLALSVPAAALASTPAPTPSASLPAGVPSPSAGAQLAAGCATGNFDLSASGSPGYNATFEGHNNQAQMVQGGGTDFCLVNSGTANWYEFMDTGSGECLNMGSNGNVYFDGCIDSTPEQWNDAIPMNHEWENRHDGNVVLTGGDGGPPYGSGVFTLPPCTGILCGTQGYFQSWATPGS